MRKNASAWMLSGLACFGLGANAPVVSAQKTPAYALKNVQIHLADGSVQKGASLVWRDGVIESIGTTVPFDAFVAADGGDSLHVYPGLLDGSANWGSPEIPRDQPRPPKMGEPPYARAGIQPDRLASGALKFEDSWMTKAQKAGFTQFASGMDGRLMPGQVEVFFVNGTDARNAVVKAAFAQKVQFEASDVYPSTLMAMMVKLRQLWNDATALMEHQAMYAAAPATTPLPAKDAVLESLFPLLQKKQSVFFKVDSKEDIERVLKLRKELGFDLVLVSAREAYLVKELLVKEKIPVLASIDVADKPKFIADDKKDAKADTSKKAAPKKPEIVSDEEKAYRARQEQAWKEELANVKELLKAGVKVGYASAGLKPEDVRKKADLLLANGYDEKELVGLMTRNTAEILGMGAFTGDLKKGYQANFIVLSKPFSDTKATVLHHVAGGNLKTIRDESSGPAVMRGRRPSEN